MKEVMMKKYAQKLCTPGYVAQLINSGDRIFFSEFALRPESLDEALAHRAHELQDVMIDGVCITKIPKFIEAPDIPSFGELFMQAREMKIWLERNRHDA